MGRTPKRPRRLDDEWINLDRAAEVWGTSRDTVRRAIARGELPAFRLPGDRQLRVRRSDMEALLESRQVPTGGWYAS